MESGDIGEMSENGVITIIDRKKNLIKLSQGEYVAVEYLEKVYCVSPTIEDVRIKFLVHIIRLYSYYICPATMLSLCLIILC